MAARDQQLRDIIRGLLLVSAQYLSSCVSMSCRQIRVGLQDMF
jgi:hypothetical protein